LAALQRCKAAFFYVATKTRRDMMIRFTIALIALIAFSFPAQARHHHYKHHYYHHIDRTPVYVSLKNPHKRSPMRYSRSVHRQAAGRENVIGGRPAGCPHAYCGCSASLYLFHTIRADLNLAANWIRKFPRTSPAPGMAAARNHHVMVLISHVGGSEWLVHDGNSGHGLTREHVRSISGYIVVNPHGGRYASM
jgi:hypothetical protein